MAHMIKKEIIRTDRIRKIQYPFGWIPQRFITSGLIKTCSQNEVSLYIFLSIVSDRYGLSFYGNKTICGLLGITEETLKHSRQLLEERDLIAYKKPLYQVLALPEQ